jgi:hypothetical protein
VVSMGLRGQQMPPPSTGTDCRQLGLKALYVCVNGCDLALGLRPHDGQIAFGPRGRSYQSFGVIVGEPSNPLEM